MKRDVPEIRSEAIGLRAWAGKSSAMPWAHRHNELELNYVLRGTAVYLIAGSLVTLPPRRLCALWGGVPHQLIVPRTPAPEVVWVTVPLAQVLAWNLPGALVPRLLSEGVVFERAEYPGDLALLHQWIADLEGTTATGGHAALLEIEARLWRMASRLRRVSRAQHRTTGPDKCPAPAGIPVAIERLAQFLAQHYQEPVTISQAAQAAHVHPHYAMTLFRRHTGMTLLGYLTPPACRACPATASFHHAPHPRHRIRERLRLGEPILRSVQSANRCVPTPVSLASERIAQDPAPRKEPLTREKISLPV